MHKVKAITVIALLGIFNVPGVGQNKKAVKNIPLKTTSIKNVTAVNNFVPAAFTLPASVGDVSDVKETNAEYQSLKSLIETNGVEIVYADSTFRPKEPLRRGDFMISFNAALNALKKTAEQGGLSASAINIPANDQSAVLKVSEIRDIKETSLYYPAVQSLIEQYGITAPFGKSRLLNAGATMSEAEVYDILKGTLGYNSSGLNPYAPAITRSKFAMVLNNALNLKLTQVNTLVSLKKDSLDSLEGEQQLMLKTKEKGMKDSAARQAGLSRIEALKKEAEAWSKLSDSEKRKQLKSR